MKILWLVSWYPSQLAPFDGDFIQRHARAVSLYDDVEVIYVVRDKKGMVTKKKMVTKTQRRQLNETIIYYYLPRLPVLFLNKIASEFRYRRYYKQAIKEYMALEGKPDIVHLHVSLKAGPVARWVKRKYKIDYLLTEHWTGFLPEADNEFKQLPFFIRKLVTRTLKNARAISAVSNYLAAQLKQRLARQDCTVIANVVDSTIFIPQIQTKTELVRFLHISTLGHQKNPDDILKAFAMVKRSHTNFRLDIFGPENGRLTAMAVSLGLQNYVCFHQEVPQEELAKYMRGSDALLLYSRYETFGCVVIEANACGLPVIVSDIPVMHENVRAGFNGILVKGEHPEVLAKTLLSFIRREHCFDPKAISDFAIRNYSFEPIGLKFHNWYRQMKA